MSSASKALELLSHFSATRPEIGLSQMCRIAKRDKATTYRYLQTLEEAGFVERHPVTRHYRLGPALLQLADIRESTVPRKEGAQNALALLADATGETAHATVLSGSVLYGLTSCESPRHGTRAVVDLATFPLHATASGICALAFGPESLFDQALLQLDSFTRNTPQDVSTLSEVVTHARNSGFGIGDRSFESDIHAISAPLFDQTGQFAGAVAVASVASRCTPNLERVIKTSLITASREITHNWGGKIPAGVETLWSTSLSHSSMLEPAS